MPSTKAKSKAPDPITVKQLAERLEVDPKELRAWLRAQGKGLGTRGKRYEFTPKQADDLHAKWNDSKAAEQDDEA